MSRRLSSLRTIIMSRRSRKIKIMLMNSGSWTISSI